MQCMFLSQQYKDIDSFSTFIFYLKLLVRIMEQLGGSEEGEKSSVSVVMALVDSRAINDLISSCITPKSSMRKKKQQLTRSCKLPLRELQITLLSELTNILEMTQPLYSTAPVLNGGVQRLAGKLMDWLVTSDWKDADRTRLLYGLSHLAGEQCSRSLANHLLEGSLNSQGDTIDGRADADCLVPLMSARGSYLSSVEFKALLELAIQRRDETNNQAAGILKNLVEGCSVFSGASLDYSLLVDRRSFELLLDCHPTAASVSGLCAALVRLNPSLGKHFGELCCCKLLPSSESLDLELGECSLMKATKLDLLPAVCAYFEQTSTK